jgi:isopenicillin N synthase-like dioxygenase
VTPSSPDQPPVLRELELEATIGGIGVDADDRVIPVISLAGLTVDRGRITDALWRAATEVGFFQLADHGIAPGPVDAAFAAAEAFFALPEEVKAHYPWRRELNAGWESRAQVRPSTRVADQKESYQVTRPHMDGLWPSEEEVPGFRSTMLAIEAAAWRVAMDVLSCFADRLGFDPDFFERAHDPEGAGYQSTVRLLHYFPMTGEEFEGGEWRAGAHTDYDCLTLLFQRAGQSGLQVCPGEDAHGGRWTSVAPDERLITCNIGDMLMRWSDDRLRSTLHRVRGPELGVVSPSRYSLAFFAQANKPALIESPSRRFEPITAAEFLQQRINANFTR